MTEAELIALARRGEYDPESLTESEIQELAMSLMKELQAVAPVDVDLS